MGTFIVQIRSLDHACWQSIAGETSTVPNAGNICLIHFRTLADKNEDCAQVTDKFLSETPFSQEVRWPRN